MLTRATASRIVALFREDRQCEYCLITGLCFILVTSILLSGHFGSWGITGVCTLIGSSLISAAILNPRTNQNVDQNAWQATQSAELLFLESLPNTEYA